MTDPDKERGLYGKYYVTRADGQDKPGSAYFILDYGNDPLAREALKTYIMAANDAGYEQLAADLHDELLRTSNEAGVLE